MNDPCPGCGFVYDESQAGNAGDAIVAAAAGIASVLRDGGEAVRSRPDPGTWSALEYACHVRDVLLVQRERAIAALWQDSPPPTTPMGRDERVALDGYADQDPGDVARQLGDAAALFANVLSRLHGDQWERTLTYNYPSPANRSLRWLAVHTVHEVRHHAADIAAGVDAVAGRTELSGPAAPAAGGS